MASFNEDFHDREKSDVDEVPAGTASPEKTSEITRAPAGYEAMMFDDMARYGHPAWDLWKIDMAKEMPVHSEKSDVDEVPAGTASPEKTSEITRAPAGYEAMMFDDMARYGHPAWDLWKIDMAKEMPVHSEKSDVDEVPAGTASPEKTSEITRAPAGYEAMMFDDMARYGHPAWDLWMIDMAKEMPDFPTLQQEEFRYVSKRHIADNRVSPNKVSHDALSSKSATEIVGSILSEIVDRSTSPRQDKVNSPLAIPNEYPDCYKKSFSCNENITTQGVLPLSKMLTIDDDDTNKKGRCADKAAMQQTNIANTSNKEIEDLIDNRTCSWIEMYEEINNTKNKTATPRTTRKQTQAQDNVEKAVQNDKEITERKKGLKQRFKSTKIGKAIFKKSEKKRAIEIVDGALNCDTKKKKKKGGVIDYLRSSWIGRKLCLSKSMTQNM